MKKVVILDRGNFFEVCHTRGGLFNPFASFDNLQGARDYCEKHGYKITNVF